MDKYRELILDLLNDPEKLKTKKPFTRAVVRDRLPQEGDTVDVACRVSKYISYTLPL